MKVEAQPDRAWAAVYHSALPILRYSVYSRLSSVLSSVGYKTKA